MYLIICSDLLFMKLSRSHNLDREFYGLDTFTRVIFCHFLINIFSILSFIIELIDN